MALFSGGTFVFRSGASVVAPLRDVRSFAWFFEVQLAFHAAAQAALGKTGVQQIAFVHLSRGHDGCRGIVSRVQDGIPACQRGERTYRIQRSGAGLEAIAERGHALAHGALQPFGLSLQVRSQQRQLPRGMMCPQHTQTVSQ